MMNARKIELLTCNPEINMIVFILPHYQNSRFVQAGFQRRSAFYTVTSIVLLYINLWKKYVLNPFHA